MTQLEDGCTNAVAYTEEDCYPGPFIPLQCHHHMLTDEYRMGAFKAAIGQSVFPGAKVLDFRLFLSAQILKKNPIFRVKVA